MKRNCMDPCLTDGSLVKMMMKMIRMSQSITEQREKRGEKRKREDKDEERRQTKQDKHKQE